MFGNVGKQCLGLSYAPLVASAIGALAGSSCDRKEPGDEGRSQGGSDTAGNCVHGFYPFVSDGALAVRWVTLVGFLSCGCCWLLRGAPLCVLWLIVSIGVDAIAGFSVEQRPWSNRDSCAPASACARRKSIPAAVSHFAASNRLAGLTSRPRLLV